MGLTKEDIKKLEWLWQDGHEIDWIESFIKIADKDSNIIPFKLTKQQKQFVKLMTKFNIILKSRQLGFSLVVCALAIRKCIVTPYSNCLLVSMDQKSTNEIFDKLKIMYDNLPSWLKPDTIANNRQQIKMTNGSKITCVTEGNKDIGRGATNTIVHLSEYAFWKNPQKQLKSIQKTLVAGGIIVIESTANSLNFFNELYFKAKNKENDYSAFFFNWIEGRELFEKDYKLAVERWKARNNGKMLTKADLDDDELELIKLGATLDQLVFRRLEIETDGIDAFHQERPSTDLEAFLSTGQQIFDNKRIDEVEKAILSKKDKYIPKNGIVDLSNSLRTYYGKSFYIYHLPEPGMRYYIGVDCSEGVGQDYSVCVVYDKHGKECAMFKNNTIKPYQFAQLIFDIGHLYNKGIIGVEKASGGHSVIEKLFYELKYKNMSRYQTYDERNKAQWNPGFDTNSKTKGLIINNLREMFETGQIQVNSRELLEELKVFEIKENGVSMGAMRGRNDDIIIATAIALELLKTGTYYKY